MFGSPRYHANAAGFYELLREVKVLESNGISSVLKISQDGKSVEAVEPLGDLHIAESQASLKIFVPRDKAAQEFCFGGPLPERVADWLMRDPQTQIRESVDRDAVAVLTNVLGCDPSNVHRNLEFWGIVPVKIPNQDAREEDATTDSDAIVDTPTRGQTTPVPWTSDGDSRAPDTPAPSVDTLPAIERTPPIESIIRQTGMVTAAPLPRVRPALSAPPAPPREQISSEDTRYRELLDRVIAAAPGYVLPSEGAFDMEPLLSALPNNDTAGYDGTDNVSRFRSSSQLERDKKIGAAGELFVSQFNTWYLSRDN